MSSIMVIGGSKLNGEIKIQGSKNAALPIIAATILNKGITVLKNCPKILDVFHMIKVLKELGCVAIWEGSTLIIDTTTVNSPKVSEDSVQKMRSSILFLGALLGRCHEVSIAYPGGCLIGKRPIDYHLDSIKKMNVNQVFLGEDKDIIHCFTDKIVGTDIFLKFPSVGATQNIILAAVLSEGVTRIFNAAREPEVVELCNFLLEAGARICGKGTAFIEIEGVKQLHDVEFTLSSDRIVTGTYMAAVAAAGGNVILHDVPIRHIESVIRVLDKVGCNINPKGNSLKISCDKRPNPYELLKTKPYPGFPTDMQSQLMTVLSIADGESTIVEEIFESRYQNVNELKKMGANITVINSENKALISGVKQLKSAVVKAHDLRAGAALVIAGLVAEGRTIVKNSASIERGYEDICRDLSNLGANIKFCSGNIL
ncbi:UDP-N-acetylglucosamine 1-carboxyvinyltransferase [Herbinix luporum]|jgi:UDP-N-acetylglucosamine 1-carboxyvinyltransferase|uniref:UDP-N-acetylglucosamine 1-carboxyvinyltransferase n=1 Tax=Herbinix luporum TaxID=1679721 RepID=A0A0K8J4V5_9FIRM|nr:UDP-N-acetylglucosamine 1-carboxyvinyltransferase [Herbinix luporum]MDI9489303.1 UDP-N-acetylglucosamine 1-carboxyvinyltransferase [Bacillota bacterium]CUH92368.1 UDP-N-acetylglucosamine 1-carboxyvinyltransferase 2 [Herbinix luporum]